MSFAHKLSFFLIAFFLLLPSIGQSTEIRLSKMSPSLDGHEEVDGVLKQINSDLIDCQVQADSNEDIIHCTQKLPHYPKQVHFFVPTKLDINRKVETFVHFHGHNIGRDHFYKTKVPGEGHGDYGVFLEKSKVNGIVVIPESDSKCTTYDQFFASPTNTSAFFKDITNTLNLEDTRLHLSGHSGAYRVLNRLARVANQGKIKEIENIQSFGLFDATYGAVDQIEIWANKTPTSGGKRLLYNTFVIGPKATASRLSLEMMEKYKEDTSSSFFFRPVSDPNEKDGIALHFNVLRDGSLKDFFIMAEKR